MTALSLTFRGASAALLATAALTATAAAAPPQYNMFDLGTIPASYAGASGINNARQVTGYHGGAILQPVLFSGGATVNLPVTPGEAGTAGSINSSGAIVGVTGIFTPGEPSTATLWENGTMTKLPTLPSGTPFQNNSSALDINDAGLIVGQSAVTGGTHAVSWNNGIITDLGGVFAAAKGVNNMGQIVGYSSNSAALWQGGVLTDLGPLSGGTNSAAHAINDNGIIVGYSNGTGIPIHPVVWSGGTATDLGLPAGGIAGMANDINFRGDILGSYTTNTGERPFLYSEGVMYDFFSLLVGGVPAGVNITAGGRINDAGEFVGSAIVNGEAHYYLFSPVPEPSAAGLALLGAAGALSRRRKPRGASSSGQPS